MNEKHESTDISRGSKRKSDFAYFIENIVDTLLRMVAWISLISVMIIGIYEIPNISAWDDITDNYTCIMNNFYVNENSSVDDIEMLNNFIETLPPVFIEEFRNNWRVIIDDHIHIPIDWNNNITVGGYTDWNSRIIFIRRQENYVDTLNIFVHELGHCFDLEYGSVSYSDLFSDIYGLYKNDFIEQYTNSPDGYSTSSAVEFFAACFKEYMLCPEHLKTEAPKAYNFVDYFYKDIQEIKYIYVYDLGAVANTVLRLAD
jgi:hypothetical protein